jgi:multidrug resistance efflux pump
VWLATIAALVALGGSLPMHGRIPGIVDSAHSAVTAPVDGRVASVLVMLHQEVEAGQVVARLDDKEVRLQISEATYELERLRADLLREAADRVQQGREASAEHGLDAGVEQRRLVSAVEAAQLGALTVRTQLEEARVRLQGATVELDRLTTLAQQDMVGDTEVVRMRTERDALQKRVTELQGLYEEHRLRVETANQRVREFAPAGIAAQPVDTALAPLRWALKAQEANLERIAAEAGRLDLRAPIRGRVTNLAVQAGEWTTSGTALATIVDATPRRILAYVPDAVRSQLAAQRAVRIHRADASFLGTTSIQSISPTVVPVPERLWSDPRVEEWAYEVVVAATGLEVPGERVHLSLDP